MARRSIGRSSLGDAGSNGGGAAAAAPTGSWSTAWEHCEAQSTTPVLRVTVSEPQTAGTYMTKYVTYRIMTQPFGFIVRRRYSDFTWLRRVLCMRYTGMLIPSLPPKSSTSASTALDSSTKEDSTYVLNRMRLLGMFVENVCKNPYLRGDSSVLAFLSTQSDRDWDAARTEFGATDLFSDTSAGCTRWRESVTNIKQDPNGERVLTDVRGQLDGLERELRNLRDRAAAMVTQSKKWSDEVASLGMASDSLYEVERDMGDSQKVEHVNANFGATHDTMTHMKILLETWREISQQETDLYEGCLRIAIQYQVQEVRVLRDLMDHRDAATKDFGAAQRKLAQLRQDKQQGKTESAGKGFFSTKKVTIDDAIKEAEEAAHVKGLYLAVVTTGLLWSEIDRFHVERQRSIQRITGLLGAGSIFFAQRTMEMWNTGIVNQGLNFNDLLDECKFICPVLANPANASQRVSIAMPTPGAARPRSTKSRGSTPPPGGSTTPPPRTVTPPPAGVQSAFAEPGAAAAAEAAADEFDPPPTPPVAPPDERQSSLDGTADAGV